MARISSAPEGGKFRARAAAALDATEGAWGNGELLCVAVDGNGELVLSDGTDVAGVIWTPESRRESSTDLANFRQVIGGKVYTVFTWAEIQELAAGDDPTFGAGDQVYGDAAGAAAVGGEHPPRQGPSTWESSFPMTPFPVGPVSAWSSTSALPLEATGA
jgi:hypothetical protein